MKKKIIIIIAIGLVIILAIALGILKHNKDLQGNNNDKRYLEIKESTKKAVEWNIKVMYPNCPIIDTFDENSNKSGTHYNSSFLISNGYIKKEELLDVYENNYCDVYVVIQANYEDPLDHQNNCSTAYKIYLKCKDYEDKGYMNWEK